MAHIPDGFLSPTVIAGTATLSAVAVAIAARRSGRKLRDRQAPALGAVTAFVFAAQMLNFPLGAGASAHLLGGVLVAVIAGPSAAILALFAVLLVQALLFQDGGIAALGANTLNLAVLGAGGGYLVYRWQMALTGAGHRRRLAAAGVAAFVSALATGLAVGVQLALSGMVPLRSALLAVGGAHVLVGAAEAVLTVGILGAVLRARPDLVREAGRPRSGDRAAVVVATAAVAVAGIAVAWGTDRPDALESALEALGPGVAAAPRLAPMAHYDVPVDNQWVAALVGVVAVFGVGWALFRLAARSQRAA
ncbi:MAG: cobalt transporter [Gemmatimonadetes bacterium]|nr:energy-coupling factor ABC transporter permease [Gemmatimonadota bacterium]NIQ56513.1 energy-coupling factor ABC transporter permease [Gemmatimonadota bacterium]NIU76713.1 cobalt transporter [Gammaproteobacteria bacterium]NIX46123.1 cobalt transporter [Gemmatimonadota bacterium]NIY10441.1 cobalt transporter [Gemmatimonadota bacterium]